MRCGSEIYAVCPPPSLTHAIKSQERHLWKNACDSWQDLTKPNTYHKSKGTPCVWKKKAPAAAWKTSAELKHVIKSRKRDFLGKKRRLRQPGGLQQSIYVYIYMYTYMCIHIYICTYVYIYMYIYVAQKEIRQLYRELRKQASREKHGSDW